MPSPRSPPHTTPPADDGNESGRPAPRRLLRRPQAGRVPSIAEDLGDASRATVAIRDASRAAAAPGWICAWCPGVSMGM